MPVRALRASQRQMLVTLLRQQVGKLRSLIPHDGLDVIQFQRCAAGKDLNPVVGNHHRVLYTYVEVLSGNPHLRIYDKGRSWHQGTMALYAVIVYGYTDRMRELRQHYLPQLVCSQFFSAVKPTLSACF